MTTLKDALDAAPKDQQSQDAALRAFHAVTPEVEKVIRHRLHHEPHHAKNVAEFGEDVLFLYLMRSKPFAFSALAEQAKWCLKCARELRL